MTPALVLTILSFGLARGFLHALDPDHIMTISALSSRQNANDINSPRQYAIIWSLGHGIMILAVASAFLMTGQELPAAISASAEFLVGIILILTGVSVLWALRSQSESRDSCTNAVLPKRLAAAPLMIGFVHGIAGSASLLALIPIAFLDLGPGFAFVLVFCTGVLLAMIIFSTFYERIQELLVEFSSDHIAMLHTGVGLASIGLGVFWLLRG